MLQEWLSTFHISLWFISFSKVCSCSQIYKMTRNNIFHFLIVDIFITSILRSWQKSFHFLYKKVWLDIFISNVPLFRSIYLFGQFKHLLLDCLFSTHCKDMYSNNNELFILTILYQKGSKFNSHKSVCNLSL